MSDSVIILYSFFRQNFVAKLNSLRTKWKNALKYIYRVCYSKNKNINSYLKIMLWYLSTIKIRSPFEIIISLECYTTSVFNRKSSILTICPWDRYINMWALKSWVVKLWQLVVYYKLYIRYIFALHLKIIHNWF